MTLRQAVRKRLVLLGEAKDEEEALKIFADSKNRKFVRRKITEAKWTYKTLGRLGRHIYKRPIDAIATDPDCVSVAKKLQAEDQKRQKAKAEEAKRQQARHREKLINTRVEVDAPEEETRRDAKLLVRCGEAKDEEEARKILFSAWRKEGLHRAKRWLYTCALLLAFNEYEPSDDDWDWDDMSGKRIRIWGWRDEIDAYKDCLLRDEPGLWEEAEGMWRDLYSDEIDDLYEDAERCVRADEENEKYGWKLFGYY